MNSENLNRELATMIGDDEFKVPGLGVIVFRDGHEVFATFLGKRNLELNLPVTRQTRFRAASLSKIFTALTIMQLVEKGKINLDADCSNYLNFVLRNPKQPMEKITVRMLASHLSSIRDGKIYSIAPKYSLHEFFSSSGHYWEDGNHFASAQEKVGEYFHYCNLNYGVLGTIIENVTGIRFDLWQKENILNQLEIHADYVPSNLSPADFQMLGTIYQKKDSHGVWNEYGPWHAKIDCRADSMLAADTLNLQNPYDESYQNICNLKDYKIGNNATLFSPQGGLRISFDELSNTLQMFINDGVFHGRQILSVNSLRSMTAPQWIFNGHNGDTQNGAICSYGLGIYHLNDFARNFYGHTGAAFGLLAALFFNPKSKSGFIYMSNGTAISEDDPRSHGNFTNQFIWEENILHVLSRFWANLDHLHISTFTSSDF